MDYDDWMKASDYNSLRSAILDGHQHTGGDDGPRLNDSNFLDGSITRAKFTTRTKYISAFPFVYDTVHDQEIEPDLASSKTFWVMPFNATTQVDASATFPLPYDMIGSTVSIYLHIFVVSTVSAALFSASSVTIKTINAGNSNSTQINTIPVTTLQLGQKMWFLGDASVIILLQPALLNVQITGIQLSNSHPYEAGIGNIILKYTSRP